MSASSGVPALLLASRPISWVNTGLPFLAAAFDETRALTPAVVLGTLYFLGPYNLLLYGVNDLFDYASDVANPRKGSAEGGLVAPSEARRLWLAIALTNLPLLAVLAWLGGPVAAIALAVTVLVAVVYSAPPLRTKERPFLDSLTSALHFVLPVVCGFLVAGRAPADLPWVILAGFVAWGVASHAIGAIQDVAYDRAAGIGSIATALGARPTAALSLVAYTLAIAAALTLPAPWGPVVALALAPYLLLPLMVLARPDETQARRAWRSFMGLAFVVGFVLTQVLLRYWGITRFDAWELAIALAAGGAGLVLANVLLTRWATRRRLRADAGPLGERLTVVVPCRDEAERLPALLAALATTAAAEPGLRIVVMDDGSTDDTAAIARRRLEPLGGRARVLHAPPKPAGWAGKSWAVDRGVDAADTELVLVLDADTVPAPGALPRLVAELDATRADLLSGVTRYDMPTVGERVVVPGFALLLFGFVPVWLSALGGGRPAGLAFAYGPLQLVRRDAYRAVGGHAADPGSAREDVDLARRFARAGRRVATVHAADLAATRHYADAGDALGAWRRILPAYAGWSVAVALTALAGQLLAYALPLVLPLAAAALAPDRLRASLVPLALLAVARVALAVVQRQPLVTVLLHPLTVGGTLVGQLAGLVALVAGHPIDWHGRTAPGTGREALPETAAHGETG